MAEILLDWANKEIGLTKPITDVQEVCEAALQRICHYQR